jgi:protein-L-isoaspartate(D-aspartate) O-methyltransferase
MDFEADRLQMVARQIEGRGIREPRVLAAMRMVPRHRFVSDSLRSEAYGDHPLSIGEGQTISQPYMVAAMTEALMLRGSEKVLEVGTGSGYQAAILADLAKEVISIERLATLAEQARARLAEVGITNIQVVVGDGTQGWPDRAPYDAILVTAGAPSAPAPLLDQLAPGGTLVVPVGDRHGQILEIHHRLPSGRVEVQRHTPCRFVDLIGEHGW